MSDAIIRFAKPEELRLVQDLNYELIVSDNSFFDDLDPSWPYEAGEDYFRKKIMGDDGVCLVAEHEEKVVGYLAGGLERMHAAYSGKRARVENICVTSGARRHGVGHALVKAFYDWCRQQHVDHVMVTAYAPNERAVDFYRQVGFVPYSNTLWCDLSLDKD